tara:strand:- start:1136 stop:1381 length:246 start_codon:yes stop_codon:yes gene_type:complete
VRISTEIYRGKNGNYWKVTREGEDVIIEQAIEPVELIHHDTYEQQRDLHKPVEANVTYEVYNSKANVVRSVAVGVNLDRKV